MSVDISCFKYLWDGSDSDWALLHVNAKKEDESPRYLIVNTASKQGKIIEDEILFNSVIKQMLDAGVRVVTVGNGF
jgi:hypothetical protein